MSQLWPELLVLVLFLASDLLWNGMASAIAGVLAGLSAFAVLLLFKKKKPWLIVEGLLFGGITALGELVPFPGGSLILMELVIGIILIVSVPAGWDLFRKMAGGMGRGLITAERSRSFSLLLGGVFTIHAVIYSALSFSGAGGIWIGAGSFLLMYFAAIRIFSSRKTPAAPTPVLINSSDGRSRLELTGTVLGEFSVGTEPPGVAEVSLISVFAPPHEFLKNLGVALKGQGFSFVFLTGWNGDDLELEMGGFVSYEGKWRKRI